MHIDTGTDLDLGVLTLRVLSLEIVGSLKQGSQQKRKEKKKKSIQIHESVQNEQFNARVFILRDMGHGREIETTSANPFNKKKKQKKNCQALDESVSHEINNRNTQK